ncbi:2-oxopent-4-enoate hydratase [Marinobacter sp. NP-6]|uniref:2-oxopent-4-enoate hydratase n=1 Tax=Marinobacter sp. NP-6 TaxID=2488666 RepID=UPI000FCA4506|nr:2-oxopent-4-enoate hydratase [Marinobacter sp. NP-6]RUT76973.1 2-oxopent-4-enoate hydratase [Marinobacter sp. NP-6]
MSSNSGSYELIAEDLFSAFEKSQPIDSLTDRFPELTIQDSYQIQQLFVSRRCDSGEKIIGKKIGVTSQAVMDMLGVDQPDFGQLTDRMVVNQGETIAMSGLIQPKAEGEIAFVLKRDLCGPGVTVADVLRATEGVMACFEIVDSRIRDWKIKIQDTVADNASCGVFVLGDRLVDHRNLDLVTTGMVLEKNGRVVGTGAGAATMGAPAVAVAWLANTLGELGMSLKAGEVILSGALSAMVPVKAGDNLRMTLAGIGGCSVRFD